MSSPAWVQHAIWWHIYPLGFVGAYPSDAPPPPGEHRLRRVVAWLDHAVELGASGIALGPIFASRTHGYDTTDHYRIDPRLGDDGDFDYLVAEAHQRGLRVLLDGVFNHVGTDFARYRAEADGADAPGATWFRKRDGGLHTFEGHGGLITLNHRNPAVRRYVSDVMAHWLGRGADGWRLDAAYAAPDSFWANVIGPVKAQHPDAWFVGEVIHGDYAARVAASTYDSVTQYELWKAIWSALNDGNFYELDWALRRHNEFLAAFVPLTFIGNHDVTRIASQLTDPRHVAHALALLMTIGGVPSIYAGDEYGWRAVKEERHGGDDAIRPEFGTPPADLDEFGVGVWHMHQSLIGVRRRHPWLYEATTSAVRLDNRQYLYVSRRGDDVLAAALNIGDTPLTVDARDLGWGALRVLAGSGGDGQVERLVVEPHGWAVLGPA